MRNCRATVQQPYTANRQRLILGDAAECQDGAIGTCMANAALIEFEIAHHYLNVITSVVGLPPVFIYRDSERTVIASDIHLLGMVDGVSLHFNQRSIMDMCRIGYPRYGKTLFREVEMLPTGSSFTWSRDYGCIKKIWTCTEQVHPHATDSPIERVACSFKRAMASIDTSRSFLSLTGGLDTRTILALLVTNRTDIPSYTITGPRLTIDARISSNLCKVYGIRHELVVLDDAFLKNLPGYITEASRLSGGLSSLDEAHEVYFYSIIGKDLESRLSGNLGNQLGRCGAEKISMRNVSKTFLNKELLISQQEREADWHPGFRMESDGFSTPWLLRGNDFLPASVANYCIGSNYAVQQSPYANRTLIEDVLAAFSANNLRSRLSLRLRDLRHRFIGHSAEESFQVRIINEMGGYVSSCPINWGWRANGRFSFSGSAEGCLAFLDVALARCFPSVMSKNGPAAFCVTGIHNYKYPEYWLKKHLKDFVRETLSSSSALNSGLFDRAYLMHALEEHFSDGQDYTEEIQLSLDLALAQKLFNGGL